VKILRILVITACLNISFAHAGGETTAASSMLVPVAKAACFVGGLIVMHDSLHTMTDNKGTILLPPVPESLDDTNRVYRETVGVVEFIAGYLIALGCL